MTRAGKFDGEKLVDQSVEKVLAGLFEDEWAWRRKHLVRDMGARIPIKAQLPDVDAETQKRKQVYWRNVLDRLDELDFPSLTPDQQEDVKVFRQQVEALEASQRFRDFERPFNAFVSFWDDVASVIRQERFETERKYSDLLSLMAGIPRYFDQHMDNMRAGMERGFVQPRAVVEACLETLGNAAGQSVEKTDYFGPFTRFPDSFPLSLCQELREEALLLINTRVLPALEKLHAFLGCDYLERSSVAISINDLPVPKDYYATKIRDFTTLQIDPDTVFDIGLREVDAMRANMLDAMRATGFSGELPDFLHFLRTDPRFYAGSSEELLMRASWICRKIEGRLDEFFGTLPRQRFAIKPVPDAIASAYPPATGAPGLYLINTWKLETRPLYLLPVLSLHEAVPGHCFQMALAGENSQRWSFRSDTYGVAYGNAWALYCEKRLGVEMGIYETPYELFGAWSFLALRAVRMVVDVGVHQLKWDYGKARQYMLDNTALPPHVVDTELTRYISWPGQALGYYLGMLSIERARLGAETRLGSKFDIRAFHDRILGLGPVPLSVLEASVETFIDDVQAGRP